MYSDQSSIDNRNLLGEFCEVGDEEIEKLCGSNFLKMMKETLEMEDTFGICGIVANMAAGCLVSERWRSVSFDPRIYKAKSDEAWRSGVGKSGVYCFVEDYKNLFYWNEGGSRPGKRFASTFIKQEYEDRDENKSGMMVAMHCDYPTHGGKHTHWLAIGKEKDHEVMILGDMSPFGLKCFGVWMEWDQLEKTVGEVLGQVPSTRLTSALQQQMQQNGDNPLISFDYNLVKYIFL